MNVTAATATIPFSSIESVRLSGLTLGYNSHPAVHHLSAVIDRGSVTAVAGPNGSGKSTLMKGIAGLLKPMSGSCDIAPNQRIAYLPQQSEVDRHFPATVFDIVSLGLWQKRGLFGRYSKSDRSAIADAVAAVGLTGFEGRTLDTLSGGQMQRALFARVLLQQADLILLDEPFNAVDAKTTADLIELIKHWQGENRTVIVVAHDTHLIRDHFAQTLLIARQKIGFGASNDVLSNENLARARRFTEAWNENAPWCDAPGDMDHAHHDHASHDHEHREHERHHTHHHDGKH